MSLDEATRELGHRVCNAMARRAKGKCPTIATVRPFAVDVNSGVSASEGRKSLEKIRAFIAEAKTARVEPGPDHQRRLRFRH